MSKCIVSITDLKKKYPFPKAAPSTLVGLAKDEYCVGGALCMENGLANRFPTTGDLVYVLKKCNPKLPQSEAQTLARKIIISNEYGRFDEAWHIIERALMHGRAEQSNNDERNQVQIFPSKVS